MPTRTATKKRGPKRDRPQLPKGYISRAPRGMIAWDDAERVLRSAAYMWIATTDADGRPHLVQQWFAWVDGHVYFEGSDRTRWARNLARDRRIAFGMQLEHWAAYGEGSAVRASSLPKSVALAVAGGYARKYGRGFGYRPEAKGYEEGGAFRISPEKLIVFDVKRFNASATRFTFGSEGGRAGSMRQ